MSSVLKLRPDQLVGGSIDFVELPELKGRITMYAQPNPSHDYVIGADFALGTETSDFDAAIVLDASTPKPTQVATIHGRWGERFDRLLYAAARTYNNAFILGERQFGLAILRSLQDDYGCWLWYERDVVTRGARVTDKLGWPKSGKRARDPLLRALRLAVADSDILLRDPLLIQQMQKMYFGHKKNIEEYEVTDDDLDIKLSGGGSPDLVMACMYALRAHRDLALFEPPKRGYDRYTLGDILGHEELEDEDPVFFREPTSPPSRRSRRR